MAEFEVVVSVNGEEAEDITVGGLPEADVVSKVIVQHGSGMAELAIPVTEGHLSINFETRPTQEVSALDNLAVVQRDEALAHQEAVETAGAEEMKSWTPPAESEVVEEPLDLGTEEDDQPVS